MTLPTDVKYFSSTYPSAPALYADAGGGVGWLDAVLVLGYGAAVLSDIVVVAGVATASVPLGHAFRTWMVALHSETGHEGLNGEHRVVSVTTNTYSFAVDGVPDGVYSGGATKVAPLGFEIEASRTNVRIYRSKDAERRNAVRLRVDDTNTVAGWSSGSKSLMRAEAVTDVFDVDSYTQLAGGWWHKSGAVSGLTPRSWLLVGDALGFYSAVDPLNNGLSFASQHFMQINAAGAGDEFATLFEYVAATTSSANTYQGLASSGAEMNRLTHGGRVIARALDQISPAVNVRYLGVGCDVYQSGGNSGKLSGCLGPSYASSSSFVDFSALLRMNPADARLYVGNEVLVAHDMGASGLAYQFGVRGVAPGLKSVPFPVTWNSGAVALVANRNEMWLLLPALGSLGVSSQVINSAAVGGYYVSLGDWRD